MNLSCEWMKQTTTKTTQRLRKVSGGVGLRGVRFGGGKRLLWSEMIGRAWMKCGIILQDFMCFILGFVLVQAPKITQRCLTKNVLGDIFKENPDVGDLKWSESVFDWILLDSVAKMYRFGNSILFF